MYKSHVRQIQSQVVESEKEVKGFEAEEILRKYGYSAEYSTHKDNYTNLSSNNLTFEEMVAQENAKIKRERDMKRQKLYGPRPITFDDRNGYDSKTIYSTEDGIGFKIEISSDMKLPKY